MHIWMLALTVIVSLPRTDELAIRQTLEAYRQSWLKSDPAGVLATFTEDAVLLPHHGDPPVRGMTNIRAYWFPPSPPQATTITGLELTIEEIRGDGSVAYVWGHDTVSWTTGSGASATKWTNAGTYLNVMRRMPDGSWRIQAHMWDDPANARQ